jgi:hypothetical protein
MYLFYFFSANLCCPGVLGDMLFLGPCSAYSHCANATKEKLIAEDAEAAEVRRGKPSKSLLYFMRSPKEQP